MPDDAVHAYEIEGPQGKGRLYVGHGLLWMEHEAVPGKMVTVGHYRNAQEKQGLVAFLDRAFGQINDVIDFYRRRHGEG